MLLGPATCDQMARADVPMSARRPGLQWAELASYAMIPAACLLWLRHFLSLPHAYAVNVGHGMFCMVFVLFSRLAPLLSVRSVSAIDA